MKAKVWLSVALLCGSALAYADYDAGVDEFRKKNFASAVHEWREAAEQGDGPSQFALGRMFENGLGVKESLDRAYKWYRLAADNNVIDAQVRMAELFLSEQVDGYGPADAVEWLERAAQFDHAGAQFQLGLMYLEGFAVEKDPGAAAYWFEQAADQGHIQAQNNLGSLYENGVGVSPDAEKAFQWYSQAARQGDAYAQNSLGALYASGKGVERNHAWAVFWFSQAQARGNDVAQDNLEKSLEHLQQRKISGSRVNIRAGNSTDNEVITKLKRGDTVYVLGESEGWSQVYLESRQGLGWVSSSLLSD